MNLVSYGAGFAVRNQSASGVGSALSSNTVNTKRASGSFANPAIMSFFKNKYALVNSITANSSNLSEQEGVGKVG